MHGGHFDYFEFGFVVLRSIRHTKRTKEMHDFSPLHDMYTSIHSTMKTLVVNCKLWIVNCRWNLIPANSLVFCLDVFISHFMGVECWVLKNISIPNWIEFLEFRFKWCWNIFWSSMHIKKHYKCSFVQNFFTIFVILCYSNPFSLWPMNFPFILANSATNQTQTLF